MLRFVLTAIGSWLVVLSVTPDASAWWHGRWRAGYWRTGYYGSYYRAGYYPVYSYGAYYSYPVYSYPAYSYPAYSYPVYYSAPVYACAQPVVVVDPCATVTPRLYAQPTPAPASTTPAPAPATPAPARKPEVSESTSYYKSYAVAARDTNHVNPARVVVGFWNYSPQDQTVQIDGQNRTIARGRGLTLDLPRQFVWAVAGREPQVERVAVSDSTIEIAIYR